MVEDVGGVVVVAVVDMTQQSTHHVLRRINATVMRLDRRPQGGGRGAPIIPLTPLLVAVAF